MVIFYFFKKKLCYFYNNLLTDGNKYILISFNVEIVGTVLFYCGTVKA